MTPAQSAQARAEPVDPVWVELRQLLEPGEEERVESAARTLPAALERSLAHGPALRRSLQPTVREAVLTALKQDPVLVVDAVLPVIGTLIRRYIASAMQELVDSVNLAQEQSASLRSLEWRFEALRSGRPFGEIVLSKSLLYRVEQVFLIHRDTGLLLCHRHALGIEGKDADMVSGMLTAIGDFVQDSFSAGEGKQLEIVQVGDLRVWARHGRHAILAAVVRGVAPAQLGLVLERTLAEVERDHADDLASYSGQPNSFAAAAPALEACLLGRGSLERPRSFNHGLLVAIGAVALLAIGLWTWETVRWNRLLTALRAEPGYAVTLADRGWWRHKVDGLRDPLAAPEHEVVAVSGIPQERLAYRWEPFVSLHPRMVALREFAPLKRQLEAFEIEFANDSPEPAATQVAAASALVTKMLDAGRIIGRSFSIELTGGADPTGTAERNKLLTAERVRRVAEGLAAAGVDRGLLRASAVESQSRKVQFRVVQP